MGLSPLKVAPYGSASGLNHTQAHLVMLQEL